MLSLLENVFAHETSEHDEDRLNAVEDEVHDETRKDFTRNSARHCQRDAQQRYREDYSNVVAILKDVHAREEERHERDGDAHARGSFEGAIEQAAVDQLFSKRRGENRDERCSHASVDRTLDEEVEICLAFT